MKHILIRRALVSLLTILVLAIGVTYVHSTTVQKLNIADLTSHGEIIVVGKVVQVSDGFGQNNLPYTEITIEVSEAIKGEVGGTYTFRQFGLLKPRDLGNGRTYLGVSPDGWPKFTEGEEVMLFLPKPSKIGLSTTLGLFQGKFNIRSGKISNEIDNRGLFDNVSVGPRGLDKSEKQLMQMKSGKVPAETFISFVRKAVKQNWFKKGE